MTRVQRRPVGMLIAILTVVAATTVFVPQASAATSGTVFTWGDDALGQLGNGAGGARTMAASIDLTGVIGLGGGRDHTLVLMADGTVKAWGHNNFGQVGDGTITNRIAPTTVSGLTNVVEVAAGHYHSMALKTDGTVWAWGQNAQGQLGDGTTTVRRLPVQVSGLTDVADIAGGRDMSYAVKTDGTVWSWGLNTDGELGDGTTTMRTRPVRVGTLTGIAEVAGGRDHGLALGSDGTVWAWGDNAYGELGLGTGPDRPNPAQVTGLTGVTQLTAGAFHSLALRSDGTVRAWGRNNLGQLGDGTSTNRPTPIQVPGLTSVAAVGSGRDHSLAVMQDGTARAWGRNDFGQLGDGTMTDRRAPIAIAGLTGVIELAGGQGYTAALASPGAPDTTPPTQPGKPSGSSNATQSISLSWAASDDDVSTAISYHVRRDGIEVGSITSVSTTTVGFTDTGLAPSSTHTYVVVAVDGSNNPSTPSDPSDQITVISGPPVIFSDDFSSSTFSKWGGTTRMTIDNGQGGISPPSARAQASNAAAWAFTALPATYPALCVSEGVNAISLGGNRVLLRLRTASNGPVSRVWASATGALWVRSDVSGTQISSGVQLGSGWHTIELCGTVGVSGSWTLYRDGTPIVTGWIANTGTSPIGRIEIGDTTAGTFTLGFDDIVVDQQPG